jgi:hypothetical protein
MMMMILIYLPIGRNMIFIERKVVFSVEYFQHVSQKLLIILN